VQLALLKCIVFTLVPGTVAGVPTSGTWTSPTFQAGQANGYS